MLKVEIMLVGSQLLYPSLHVFHRTPVERLLLQDSFSFTSAAPTGRFHFSTASQPTSNKNITHISATGIILMSGGDLNDGNKNSKLNLVSADQYLQLANVQLGISLTGGPEWTTSDWLVLWFTNWCVPLLYRVLTLASELHHVGSANYHMDSDDYNHRWSH